MDMVQLRFRFQLCLVTTLFRVFTVKSSCFGFCCRQYSWKNPQFLLKVSSGFMLDKTVKHGLGERSLSCRAATAPL